jgi:hypothetical protein
LRDEILGEGAKRAAVTSESLIEEAHELLQEAKSRGQISTAVAALTAKAKLAGLWIDKADNKHQHTRRYVARLPEKCATAEEWLQKHGPAAWNGKESPN